MFIINGLRHKKDTLVVLGLLPLFVLQIHVKKKIYSAKKLGSET